MIGTCTSAAGSVSGRRHWAPTRADRCGGAPKIGRLRWATVRAALDAGIDWVDTAPFYGWGRAEEIVGEAIRGRRDDITVLTKCGTIRRLDGSWGEDGSPAAVRADLEASLVRLGTDHVDVLQLHDPDRNVPIEETVGSIAELVTAGKVGHVGLSNHPVDLLRRGHAVAPIEVVQHQWSILHHPQASESARRWCANAGAAFLAWSPLASGFLVDGFDAEATAPGDLRRLLPWASGNGAEQLAVVRADAASAERSLRSHALAWAAATAYPIVGARTPDEARALTIWPASAAAGTALRA